MIKNIKFRDSENHILDGTLSIVDNDLSKPIMILCHGFTINKEHPPFPDFELSLNKLGISTLRFDLFGHGNSEGNFENITITKGVDCIDHSISYLEEQGFKKIGLLGESFGGMCSIISASKSNKLSVLCLKSPVSNYLEVEKLRKTEDDLNNWEKIGHVTHKNSFGESFKLNYSF